MEWDAIRNLFDVQFSAEHDPIREKEEAAYVMFVNLLYDCEAGDEQELQLYEVLFFFSGSDSIPVGGFETVPSLQFTTNPYPKSSTCILELSLPTIYYQQPELFKEKFIFAMKNHGGYGLT